MNGCERVSMHLLPSPPPSLFPSAVYNIVMNLRLTQPPPLPKHVTTQMNNKRSCYQVEEEYNKRVHLLTLLHLPSAVAPPFSSLLVSSSLFSSLLVSSRLFSSLLVSSSSSCPLLSGVVRVGIYQRYVKYIGGGERREGEQGRSKRMKRSYQWKGKGGEGRGREGEGREGEGTYHEMGWAQ